jgi:predicted nuclease with RNAse H fold
MAPAMTVKVVEAAPAGTVTEAAGTGSKTLLLERETVVPPAGADLVRVIVQVLKPAEFKVVGLQDNDESVVDAVKLNVTAWETPLSVAVRVAP